MKKIILFIDNLGSGGAQRQVTNIALILKKANYDVSILVYYDIPFYKPILDEAKIPVVLLESKSNLSRILKVRKYINNTNADAVIAFMETPCFIACLSKIFSKGWKLITTERSAKRSTFVSRKNKFYNIFERFSNAKVANSLNAIEMWKKYYPAYSDKYSVIYNHVLIPDEYLNTKHKYLSNGKLKMTVAASYQELKNPLGLIEAVNLLTEKAKSKLEINWYGRIDVSNNNTDIYDKAVEMVKRYGLEEIIHLHDETTEIYRIMSESDVVGLFSRVEGLPNTICEAMAIGRPIIMSEVSDYNVLVSNNGFLCNPNSVESIKNALANIISLSSNELLKMGNASKDIADKLFSEEVVGSAWMELIER